ncbi:MAG TPA: LysR family transcriptional regulator [Ktedonobacterales bacterium]|nr:LysR family transcriptional regulator [Ktedonobacterales bacterium]
MELRHLRYFVVVAEELNITRAAKLLQMAQPPLSQQMHQLEAELGVTLFHRSKRRIALTDAGQVFLEEARRTLVQAEHARRMAQRAQRSEIGRLVMGFVSEATYDLLPSMLQAYRARFPQVEIVLREMTTMQQVQALQRGSIHLGMLRPPIPETGLSLQIVRQEPFIMVLPPTARIAPDERLPLSALSEEPFVLFPRAISPGVHDQVISLCNQAGFSPTIVQEATELHTILGLVAVGIGVSLLPASVRLLRSQGVVYRVLPQTGTRASTALAWRQDARSSVLFTFLDVAKQSLLQLGEHDETSSSQT